MNTAAPVSKTNLERSHMFICVRFSWMSVHICLIPCAPSSHMKSFHQSYLMGIICTLTKVNRSNAHTHTPIIFLLLLLPPKGVIMMMMIMLNSHKRLIELQILFTCSVACCVHARSNPISSFTVPRCAPKAMYTCFLLCEPSLLDTNNCGTSQLPSPTVTLTYLAVVKIW